MKTNFSTKETSGVAKKIGTKFSNQLMKGMAVELEHGKVDPQTNITNDNPIKTGKIALAHLKELPDYYTRLEKMEDEGKADKKNSLKKSIERFGS
jgi:uncharacterized Fe-S cluster-containing radical SAM superfamily enzyme